MTILLESSYCIDIVYDALYDDHCFITRYRFETEELAKKFSEYIGTLQMIYACSVYFEHSRNICGYSDADPYRPRFSILSDAIDDLKGFINCSNEYFSLDDKEKYEKYKYAGTIDVEPISIVEKLHSEKQIGNLKKEIEYLTNEVDWFRKENERLKTELNLMKQMENKTIELLKEYDSNIEELDLSYKKIRGILDLSKFTKLKKLFCHKNNITWLINLPNSLTELHCRHNEAVELSNLPDNLLILDCRSLEITRLNNLPKQLTKLDCSFNYITSLDNLPDNLTELVCICNKISSLDNLPNNLTKLDCSDNKITQLDNLPNCLIELNCSYNKISNLDNLPNSLVKLTCTDNFDISKLKKMYPKIDIKIIKNKSGDSIDDDN